MKKYLSSCIEMNVAGNGIIFEIFLLCGHRIEINGIPVGGGQNKSVDSLKHAKSLT